jgi:hypothetical protein
MLISTWIWSVICWVDCHVLIFYARNRMQSIKWKTKLLCPTRQLTKMSFYIPKLRPDDVWIDACAEEGRECCGPGYRWLDRVAVSTAEASAKLWRCPQRMTWRANEVPVPHVTFFMAAAVGCTFEIVTISGQQLSLLWAHNTQPAMYCSYMRDYEFKMHHIPR